VERAVAESLFRLTANARERAGQKRVLFMGGVAANIFIREYLESKLGGETAFAKPRFAGDNAVGCALYAARKAL
jgi:N6-L-threonylcarbamoyladenine synthase